MTNSKKKLLAAAAAMFIGALPLLMKAESGGAEPRLTGAPGDRTGACTSCHLGTALNAGTGGVKIIMPGPNTYTPGQKQRIKVQVNDPAQKRWGFQLTARLASNESNGQAGTLASTDGQTQVLCDGGSPAPCSSPSTIQFVTHTQAGTRNGTAGPVEFEFDWTPPETDMGVVKLYAAGNAANGDNRNSGDRIYTTSVELSPAAASPKPSISAERGVVNAASLQEGTAAGSWITIKGANLATVTRTWTAEEIAQGKLPVTLEGVKVTVNGKEAYIQYVSPEKVNALTPADDAQGPVELRVTTNGVAGDPLTVNLAAVAPALFTADGKYVAAGTGENGRLDKSGQFFASPDNKAAVKPGDTVVLYATGLGATDPASPAGQIPAEAANLANPVTVTIGGVQASVTASGLAPALPWIYQVTVKVPEELGDGDQAVVIQTAGVSSPSSSDCCYLAVQR